MAKASTKNDKSIMESRNENRKFSPEEFRYYSQTQEKESTYAHINLLKSEKEISVDDVRSCLHEVAKDHYMLHAKTAVLSNGDVCFAKMVDIEDNDEWIPLEIHSTEKLFEWQNMVKEAFQKPFDFANGPMWRALWVTCPIENDSFSYMLILVICHAIIDGKAAVDLCCNQFLNRLNKTMKGDTSQPEQRPIYFPEPVEVIFGNAEPGVGVSDYPIPWYVQMMVKSLLFLKRKELNSEIPAIRCIEESTKEAVGNYFAFEINEETSKKFLKFCKQKSVTVHSVLLAILGSCLKSMEKNYENLKGSFKKIVYTVDLRKLKTELNDLPMPLGCYVTAAYTEVQAVDIGNFEEFDRRALQLSKDVSKVVQEPIKFKFLYSLMAYTLKSKKMKEFTKAFGSVLAVGLSNLGRLDDTIISEDSDLVEVVGQYFTVSIRTPFTFITTSTFKGRMYFCISYDDKWITEDFIVLLAEELQKSIETVAKRDG